VNDSAAVPIRDAATVMLVRDGAEGTEVFMLRRHLQSAFSAGAYVFPGGAVDLADRDTAVEEVSIGPSDAEASARLGLPGDTGGLAYWIAAIRECFEEAGALLAYDSDGAVVDLHDPATAERFARHRAAVHAGDRRLVDVCAEEDLRLACDALAYVSHWITPLGAPRRYDTRFFVARAPDRQAYLHDDRETIESMWVRPADAVGLYDEGEIDLVLPTLRSLEALAEHGTADDALRAAADLGQVPTMRTRYRREGSLVVPVLPGEPGYEEADPHA
jgi:8-oxo-dGTP pyrophosphatase MutT (NUDIX family)